MIEIRKDFTISSFSDRYGAWPWLEKEVVITNSPYAVSPDLITSVEERFANKPSPAASSLIEYHDGEKQGAAKISLLEYKPRSRAPRTVRAKLMEADTHEKVKPPTIKYVLGADGQLSLLNREDEKLIKKIAPSMDSDKLLAYIYEKGKGAEGDAALSATDKSSIRVQDIFSIAEKTIKNDEVDFVVSYWLEPVTWPFRPVKGHPFGIDNSGRDVLSLVVAGTRIALIFGIVLVISSMLVGVTIGSLQGYFGGVTDITTQRFIEIWSSLPFLYVMILIGSVFGRSFTILLICYGLFNWIGISYYIRAEFLRLRNRPFIESARTQGLSSGRIIRKHILPNALTPIITLFPFSLIGAIGSISALDFLGFGLPPLTPSLGELLSQASQSPSAWWLVLYPALTLFIIMLLAVFIGEGLRDAFDPKPTARYK